MSETLSRPTPLLPALRIQARVVGALMMRELHTRYGRENVGYLWLIFEPLMLGTVIAIVHSGSSARDGGINPVAFVIIGYTIFIMFRGIVNRSEGAIESNAPLLYHNMVTVMDFTIARALLEAAGTIVAFLILFSISYGIGYIELPPRPLMMFLGIGLVFWISTGVSMLVIGITYNNRLLERLVHPFTYFQIPFSAAFFELRQVPEPYRGYLLLSPLPHAFEILRYGAFEGASPEFMGIGYTIKFCTILTFFGLIAMKSLKRRIHLS